jgi:hypothetical protein
MTCTNRIHVRMGLNITRRKTGVGHTIDRIMRLGANLIIPEHVCRAVPFRAVGGGSDVWCAVRQLLRAEDAWLGVVVVECLTLEEMVDAVNFELEVIDALVGVDAISLRLRACHLQRDDAFLVALLIVDHATLEAATATLDRLGETDLHVPQFIEDEVNDRVDWIGRLGMSRCGICGIRGLGAAAVVMGIGLQEEESRRQQRKVSVEQSFLLQLF